VSDTAARMAGEATGSKLEGQEKGLLISERVGGDEVALGSEEGVHEGEGDWEFEDVRVF
jgi:hypothetical protein